MFIVCIFFIDTVIPTQQMNKLRVTEDTLKQGAERGFGARSAIHCPLCMAQDHDTLGVYLDLISAEVSADLRSRPLAPFSWGRERVSGTEGRYYWSWSCSRQSCWDSVFIVGRWKPMSQDVRVKNRKQVLEWGESQK